MDLIAYHRLSTCSKRAISRRKTRFGRPYVYVPRGRLLTRLSKELGMSKSAIYNLLMEERDYLLKQK
jgi:hypothetical protein